MKKARIEKWVTENGVFYGFRDLETFETVDAATTLKYCRILAKQAGYTIKGKIITVF